MEEREPSLPLGDAVSPPAGAQYLPSLIESTGSGLLSGPQGISRALCARQAEPWNLRPSNSVMRSRALS